MNQVTSDDIYIYMYMYILKSILREALYIRTYTCSASESDCPSWRIGCGFVLCRTI